MLKGLESNKQSTLDRAEVARLADYLRRHPYSVNEPDERLALLAEVSLATVRAAKPSREAKAQSERVRPETSRNYRPSIFKKFFVWWLRITENGPQFVLISNLVGFIISGTIGLLGYRQLIRVFGVSPGDAAVAIIFALWGFIVFLHYMVYATHGQARVVAKSCVSVFASMVLGSIIAILNGDGGDVPFPIALFLLTLVSALLTLFYGFVGLGFSVMGSIAAVGRAERARGNLGRQDLLERMFDLQERLEKVNSSDYEAATSWRNSPIARQITREPYKWAILVGFGFGTISQLVGLNVVGNTVQGMILSGLLILIAMVTMISQCMVGFVGGVGFKSAILVVISALAGIPTTFIPQLFNQKSSFRSNLEWSANLVAGIVISVGMAVIVGLASKIEHHAEYQRKLRDDDPQVLLAEYIDIQKRLNPGPREVTVVVVDAARSSLMKQMSDPFVAEWSFRAYQQVIERVTYEHGGEVLATAGDGAVLTFNEPAQGLTASRAILEKVDDFNERTNKLSMPFQLRIGVHSGQISGFINQVQYAEVIDVAAHIEAAAQIGGIAVSEKIMEQVEGLSGEKLSIAIDGFEVYQLA